MRYQRLMINWKLLGIHILYLEMLKVFMILTLNIGIFMIVKVISMMVIKHIFKQDAMVKILLIFLIKNFQELLELLLFQILLILKTQYHISGLRVINIYIENLKIKELIFIYKQILEYNLINTFSHFKYNMIIKQMLSFLITSKIGQPKEQLDNQASLLQVCLEII